MSRRYTHALSPKAARILRTPDAEGGQAPAQRLIRVERIAIKKSVLTRSKVKRKTR